MHAAPDSSGLFRLIPFQRRSVGGGSQAYDARFFVRTCVLGPTLLRLLKTYDAAAVVVIRTMNRRRDFDRAEK